jgi:hypothetical protein
MEMYYVINNSSGDTTVECITKEVLLERINEGYWGDVEFMETIPHDRDTNYWGGDVLIIKGSIVAPKPKQIITEYTID